jgi:orotidine-5'-phosphate decarboxylase
LAASTRPEHFADRLAALVEERRSRVVLGLDPNPAGLWPVALEGSGVGLAAAAEKLTESAERPGTASVAERTAEAVLRHCRAAIEAAGPACVAVKLQLACFERLGSAGWRALEAVRAAAREHGLLAIADGKRGDVPVTATAYGQALVGSTPGPYGEVEGLDADAFTVNPLLGRDSLEPLVAAAAAAGAACFVLVSTSNPGASDLQDLDADGAPLHERMASMVDSLGRDEVGGCGLSLVGAVAGATRPERLVRLRELMPRAIFLLPGVGAQGGSAEALGAAFKPHPAAGLVTASRSIVDAHRESGADPATAAAQAAQDLRRATWNM